MDKVDEIKEALEAKKDEVLDTIEDIEDSLLARKDELEKELDVIKETLGEKAEEVIAAGHEAKNWISANIKTILYVMGGAFVVMAIGMAIASF